MNGSKPDPRPVFDRPAVGERPALRVLSWLLSGIAFVVGPLIGMTVDAELGAAIWILSAVLALLPFATHRRLGERQPPRDAGGGRQVHPGHQTRFMDVSAIVAVVGGAPVYRCDEVPLDDGRRRIEIDMTMTAPGCGMGEVLRGDAARAVQSLPGVDEVDVAIVWDPPWSRNRISEAARLELGLL